MLALEPKHYPVGAPGEAVRILWDYILLGGGNINLMVLIFCPRSEYFRGGEIFLSFLCSMVREAELQNGT